jgi:hypothetical protein
MAVASQAREQEALAGGGAQRPGNSGMGIASFVCWLVGLWPIALPLGIIAWVKARKDPSNPKRWCAIWGTIGSGVASALVAILVVVSMASAASAVSDLSTNLDKAVGSPRTEQAIETQAKANWRATVDATWTVSDASCFQSSNRTWECSGTATEPNGKSHDLTETYGLNSSGQWVGHDFQVDFGLGQTP